MVKMNRKKLLSLILISLLAIGLISALTIKLNEKRIEKNINSCSIDEDCILVHKNDCCRRITSINKKYENYWNKLKRICEPPFPPCTYQDINSFKPICEKNICKFDYVEN